MCVSVYMDFIYIWFIWTIYIYIVFENTWICCIYIISTPFFSPFYVAPPLPSDADLFLNWEHFIDPKLSLISQLGLANIWVFKADHLLLNSLLERLPWRNLIHPQKLLIPWSSSPRSEALWSFFPFHGDNHLFSGSIY